VHFLRSAYDDFNHLLDSWREAIDSVPDDPLRNALGLKIAESTKKYDLDFLPPRPDAQGVRKNIRRR